MRAGGTIFLFVCTALVFIGGGAAFGASAAVNADATVTVKEIFSLALDSSSVDFGSVRQGEWKEISGSLGYANEAICKSNTGRAWTLSIKATAPFMSDSEIIPLENLKWLSTYAGNKNAPYNNYSDGLVNPPSAGYVDFTLSDAVIFRSSGASISNHNTLPLGAEVQFKYAIFIPETIKIAPGSYSTRIVYTMTE
ncbi:MAG: hypothetical protein WC527_00075 [Candidatus Margulisiibacteriota bacterium]